MHVPPPRFLPQLQSKKWHNRRLYDPVGYLRVQHLNASRTDVDLPRIIRSLNLQHRSPSPSYVTELRPLADALRLLKGMTKANWLHSQTQSEFDQRLDKTWAEALKNIDLFLEAEHEAHIEAVRKGGASGI